MESSQSYVICTTPRSGSWMLCSALWQLGTAGRPSELFGPTLGEEFISNRQLVKATHTTQWMEEARKVSMTDNGVFGTKLLANQTPVFLRRACEHRGVAFSSLYGALQSELPNLRYILLTREDKVAQAISFYTAIATQVWRRTEAEQVVSTTPLAYDRFALERCYQDVIASDRYWEGFFATHGISPHRITYEMLTEQYEHSMRNLLTYLSLPEPDVLPRPKTIKLANALSAELATLFKREGLPEEERGLQPNMLWAPF